MSIILTIIIFSIVVLIHEGGHFYFARRNDILVEEFAIGMGPILFKKQGIETLYTVRAFPLGGFCRMLGEDADCEDPRAFSSKSVRARIEVVLAGVIMNLILGFIIFLCLLSYEGFYSTTISIIKPDSPAYEAGLQVGDEILSINGYNVTSYNDFSFKMSSISPEDVNLVVDRNGEEISLNMDLAYSETDNKYIMGFSPVLKVGALRSDELLETIQSEYDINTSILPEKASFLETVKETSNFIAFYFKATISSLAGLFNGSTGLESMSGPIGIVSVVNDQYEATSKISMGALFESMLSLLGTLSLALAVFNILPLPALDGGRLVFLIIEGVRGKPINPNKEGTFHFIGFVALMLLAVVVTYSDITKLF